MTPDLPLQVPPLYGETTELSPGDGDSAGRRVRRRVENASRARAREPGEPMRNVRARHDDIALHEVANIDWKVTEIYSPLGWR